MNRAPNREEVKEILAKLQSDIVQAVEPFVGDPVIEISELIKELDVASHRFASARIVCNETNNTEESIAKNELRATVELKLLPSEFETFTAECPIRARAFRTFRLTGKTRKQKKRIRKKRRRWHYCLNGAKTGQTLYFKFTVPKQGLDVPGKMSLIGPSPYGPEQQFDGGSDV